MTSLMCIYVSNRYHNSHSFYVHWWDCILEQKLYVNRLVELTEIEGLQLAISSALDVLYVMLSKFSKVFFEFTTYSIQVLVVITFIYIFRQSYALLASKNCELDGFFMAEWPWKIGFSSVDKQ